MRSRDIRPPALTPLNNIIINPLSNECMGMDFLAMDTGFASAAWTANLVLYVPLITVEPMVVSRFFWRNGITVGGNTDIGIYNEAGTSKLVSTGSTANAGTSVIQSVDVTDFRLPACSRFWLALGCDSGTQTFWQANALGRGLEFAGARQQLSGWSSGLPATASLDAATIAALPLFGFTGGSVI